LPASHAAAPTGHAKGAETSAHRVRGVTAAKRTGQDPGEGFTILDSDEMTADALKVMVAFVAWTGVAATPRNCEDTAKGQVSGSLWATGHRADWPVSATGGLEGL
jgi:hypothetical protein